MIKNQTFVGAFCGIMTGICLGLSGVFGQFLFQTKGIDSTWLVPIRLLTSGLLLFVYVFFTNREELFTLAKNKRDFIQTIIAGIFGTMLFQATFFKAVQASNAGTATVLQYIAPVLIMIYVCIRNKKFPNKLEILSIFLAVGGIFLISTHGDIHSLSMTPEGLFWGLACAFSMFTDTLLPERLNQKYSSLTVMAWSFVFGGITLSCIWKPWEQQVSFDTQVWIALFFVIIVGSIAAYLFYRYAIQCIGPSKASLFSSIEPIAATILSVCWLGTDFVPIDFIGFAMIISIVFILTLGKQQVETSHDNTE